MAAKDGSFSFDFTGTYGLVQVHKFLEYTLDDGRKVNVTFTPIESGTRAVELFEAEDVHSLEQQQGGWQSILDNFKKYAEQHTA